MLKLKKNKNPRKLQVPPEFSTVTGTELNMLFFPQENFHDSSVT